MNRRLLALGLIAIAACGIVFLYSRTLVAEVAVETGPLPEVPTASAPLANDVEPVPPRTSAAVQAEEMPVAPMSEERRPRRPRSTTGNLTIRLMHDGLPMNSGRVVLTGSFLWPESVLADVDPATGEARFLNLRRQEYTLRLEQIPMGWTLARAAAREQRNDLSNWRLAVEEGENHVDLALEAGAALTGVVFDENGWPAQSATVRISPLDDSGVRSRNVPVENGAFHTHVLEGVWLVEVMGEARAGRVSPHPQAVTLAVGEQADLAFRFLPATEQLEIMVVDEENVPFEGLPIGVANPVSLGVVPGARFETVEVRHGVAYAKTDAQGRAVFASLPTGKVKIRVEEAAHGPWGGPQKELLANHAPILAVQLPRTESGPLRLQYPRARPVLVRGKLRAKAQELPTLVVVVPLPNLWERECRMTVNGLWGANPSFQFYVDGSADNAYLELERDTHIVRVPLPITKTSGGPELDISFP